VTNETRLNPYQRTAVAAALRQLEGALNTVDAVLRAGGDGRLTVTASDIGADERERLAAQAADVRAALSALADACRLDPLVRDGRRVMAAALALAWEGLEDIRPTRLGRYGAVDPALAATLEPALTTLIDLTLALLRAVEGHE
jgi:hypothetical protein